MLPSLSRGMRAVLIMALGASYIGWHTHDAFAKGAGDDAGDDDDDDDGGGGDKGDKGDKGDDDDDDDGGSDQPPVTSGGLYTLKTYPQNENLRPLTITQGVTQLRFGLGTDLSAKGAFGTVGVTIEGEYGVADNFMLVGGLTDAYNFKQYNVYFGFEGSLIYDLLDFRAVANVHRTAYADYQNYCSPLSSQDPVDTITTASDGSPQSTLNDPTKCQTPGAAIVSLPNGNYEAGGTKFSLDLGFPFRYAFKPQIALVLLQTLMTIDFNSTSRDHVIPVQYDTGMMDANMNEIEGTKYVTVANGIKPDLNLSAGIAANPIPQLSIVAFAAFKIPDFDTSAGNFQIPVTLRVEASASKTLDIGLEFTLLNVIPPDPQSPIDNRYLSAYVQTRF
jgi:hypothetical protein